jgi:5-oxoprolinase (ATP-hydrolysing) subunit C
LALVVVDSGWGTRVVDAGRPHTRHLGVPVGGAADRAAWMLGNALVGNDPETPALEICLKGPTLRADCDLACVVGGAPFVLSSARQTLKANRTFTLAAGEELHIGGVPVGLRAYVCVAGGIETPYVLGSRSSLDGVSRGTTFPCPSSQIRPRFFGDCPFLAFTSEWTLAAVAGLQADWFNEQEFYDACFKVALTSNRMGLRLDGPRLTMPAREMVSEPVSPGAVQVTREGQPIILGIDGQTIGGYPKIAHVSRADLDKLAQMRPGDGVRFQRIDLDEAETRWRHCERELKEWLTRARVTCA